MLIPWTRRRTLIITALIVANALVQPGCMQQDVEPDGAPAHASVVASVDSPVAIRSSGMDSVHLARARQRAAELPRLYSLLVARDGELFVEDYFHGRTAQSRANIKSASKSVISALVGIAIAEGRLQGLDQRMAPFFPEYIGEGADPRVHEITLEHLLSMQSGLEPTSFDSYGTWVSSPDWVRYVVTRPFVDQPGGRMLYSTGSTHVLSAILTEATSQSTLAWARSRLARPLGFELAPWTADPQGIYFGGNEMHVTPRALLAFGELYRNGGVHEGAQIVPASWIEESWRRRTSSPFNGHGYGLGWWMRRSGRYDVYFAWGYGGQYVFIVPDLALTVVTTSDPISPREGGHNQALHRLLDTRLIPAAEAGGAAAGMAAGTAGAGGGAR